MSQLTHQDPTEPIKDQNFIAQMAQFSALEQMQNMSVAVSSLADRQALGLVGKFVAGTEAETGETVSGVARALFYEEGQAFLEVSGRAIALKDIKMISEPEQVRQEFGGQAPAAPAATPASPNVQAAAPAAPAVSAVPAQKPEVKSLEQNPAAVPPAPVKKAEQPAGPTGWQLRNFQRTLAALESN